MHTRIYILFSIRNICLFYSFDKGTFDDPEQEIVYNFLEIQAEALAKLKSTSFEHKFNWRKILLQGKSRRQSMDVTLKNLNKPKRIYKMDAIINDTSRLVSNTA